MLWQIMTGFNHGVIPKFHILLIMGLIGGFLNHCRLQLLFTSSMVGPHHDLLNFSISHLYIFKLQACKS